MRIAGVVLGVVTVAALNLILLIGAGGEPPPWFGALVLAMDLSLIASSVALGVAFLRRGRRLLGLLFLGNLVALSSAPLNGASGTCPSSTCGSSLTSCGSACPNCLPRGPRLTTGKEVECFPGATFHRVGGEGCGVS